MQLMIGDLSGRSFEWWNWSL